MFKKIIKTISLLIIITFLIPCNNFGMSKLIKNKKQKKTIKQLPFDCLLEIIKSSNLLEKKFANDTEELTERLFKIFTLHKNFMNYCDKVYAGITEKQSHNEKIIRRLTVLLGTTHCINNNNKLANLLLWATQNKFDSIVIELLKDKYVISPLSKKSSKYDKALYLYDKDYWFPFAILIHHAQLYSKTDALKHLLTITKYEEDIKKRTKMIKLALLPLGIFSQALYSDKILENNKIFEIYLPGCEEYYSETNHCYFKYSPNLKIKIEKPLPIFRKYNNKFNIEKVKALFKKYKPNPYGSFFLVHYLNNQSRLVRNLLFHFFDVNEDLITKHNRIQMMCFSTLPAIILSKNKISEKIELLEYLIEQGANIHFFATKKGALQDEIIQKTSIIAFISLFDEENYSQNQSENIMELMRFLILKKLDLNKYYQYLDDTNTKLFGMLLVKLSTITNSQICNTIKNIMLLLLEHGAQINIPILKLNQEKNVTSLTILDKAKELVQKNHISQDIVDILEKYNPKNNVQIK